jgi:hypothetical protein
VTSQPQDQSALRGPTVRLVAAEPQVIAPQSGGQVSLDPGVWVAAIGSDLQFRVARSSYTAPVTLTQVISEPGGHNLARRLPSNLLDGWLGLASFLRITVRTMAGRFVSSQTMWFCPDSFDPERAGPDAPLTSPYPYQCSSSEPFPIGQVWGIARDWATEPAESSFIPSFRLGLGTYKVTVSITGRYVRLLHVPAPDASVTVTVKVVEASQCCSASMRPRARQGAPLPSLTKVATLTNPPDSASPDLVALPAWGIITSHISSGDLLNFDATVWVGGNSQLDVEGFRVPGLSTMNAYQYFWRDGKVIGRIRVGTMGFSDYNHWHFQQFARYVLLNSSRRIALRSHKEGFCIAPTDGVDLTLPHASWQPSFVGLPSGQCGLPTALWVQESLPVGWGDTYIQSIPGQAFNIANVPNGTYYIEVIANPEHLLKETTTSNDISLRRIILGGRPGHRTVKVPAWQGIDPEG